MRKLDRALCSGFARASVIALVAGAPRAALAQETLGEVAVADPSGPLAPLPPGPPAPLPRVHRARSARTTDTDAADEADRGPEFKEYLRLHAGPLSIQPEVLMQAQAMPYIGPDSTLEAGDPADRAGFRMRRARFGVEGRLYRRVPFEINIEFNSDSEFKPSAILHDAWFGYDALRFLQVIVGFHDVPFSRSALMGAGESALIERPFAVRAMAPFHQLGMHVEGHFFSNALSYYAGLYNGLQKASYFYQGYIENPAVLGNRFDGLTYAGRLTSEPLGSIGRTMEDLHHGKLRVAAGASGFYSDGGTVGVLGLGGDLLLHFRGLHVLGEFLANRTSPKQAPTVPTLPTGVVTSYAGVGEAGYVLLKDRLGLTARFEYAIPNTGVKDQSDNWMLTGGASYHLMNDFLKAQLDYTHREELHGASLKNDSVVLQLQLDL